MTSCKKWQREMLDYATEIGVVGAHIEHNGAHPHVVGTVAGRPFRRAISNTPGTKHAGDKARASLRRAVRDIVDPPNLLQAG